MRMNSNVVSGSAAVLIILVAAGARVEAATLSEVLSGIRNLRQPERLESLRFDGLMRLSLAGGESGTGYILADMDIKAAWAAPDNWLAELMSLEGGDPECGPVPDVASGGAGHPAIDHILLSRPDYLDLIDRDWMFEYQGTALWEGEPAWSILVRPSDLTSEMPEFVLYVRKDDFVPLRTRVELDDGTKATTDLVWLTVDGVLLPSRFATVFNPPLGPIAGYETTFFNHEVNPDLSGVVFSREEGTLTADSYHGGEDEGPAAFEELYHGFADQPITVGIVDSEGTYDQLRFTFSLYVEDPSLVRQLNNRQNEIRALAASVVEGRQWSGDGGLGQPVGKWQCGEDIREAINAFLGTDSITDFYFLEFTPLKSGES